MAFRVYQNKKTYLNIKTIGEASILQNALPEKHSLNWYRWAGPDRLVISLTGISRYEGEEIPTSMLIRYDVNQKQAIPLGRKSQGFIGDDVLYIAPDGEYLLLALQESIFDYPGVYRVNLADNSFTEIVRPQSNIWDWIADDKGIVRMGFAYADRTTRIYYRRTNDEKFNLISKIKDRDDDASKKNDLLEVVRVVSGKDEGYVLSNEKTGRFALHKFNYLTREVGEKVFDHPDNDLTSFSLSDDGSTLESVTYTDDRDRIVWFDAFYKKRQSALEKALPDQEIWLQSRSRDGNKTIVFTTSPTDPGSYFLYDAPGKKLERIAGLNDEIDPTQMAVTKYVRYPARDGLSIPAYLTLPVGRDPKALPLIILPHGGPFGVRDTLDFSSEVQFLANRGFAVLQSNYRGSDSYGEDYYKRGEGQIGRTMQDDLDDGMDWLVKQGIADPARVCIVGSSYGGYAALWGVIRNPERYRCGASFAGVTDWRSQLKYDSRSLKSRYAREWQGRVQGDKDFNLDTVSPVKLAANLQKPVLLTHGDDDTNVPFSQYKSFVAALKKAGKSVETHVYEGEGHGFEDPENEKDWLNRLEAFLAKHNPADLTSVDALPPPEAKAK
ncbi:alpha/beta hydrolase family protein [Sphingorhabdus sp.]|uniref:alpha/beta hydrolase family protein n=1 Tax=Sphingorhabdus sp. TaxID=1902408 RepID=UPI003BB1C771|nr:S9 family peptidase [Sphingomonadales bacterium]MBK9432661.1 S9 family peptidase [Sphingomonadales bacterium]